MEVCRSWGGTLSWGGRIGVGGAESGYKLCILNQISLMEMCVDEIEVESPITKVYFYKIKPKFGPK